MTSKIINKLRSLRYKVDIFSLRTYNNIQSRITILPTINERELIVSLTTYKKRFDVFFLTVESLINQSIKPNKIILWLASEELIDNSINSQIYKLKNKGVEIEIVNENIKSYKKLIYAIEKYPSATIITCDDDTIYPKYFIEDIYKKHLNYPDCIAAYRCSNMELENGRLKPYLEWISPANNKPSFRLFPTGVGGILYPPNSLNKMVLNKNLFLALCPLGDDIWFKAMALLNNVKTVMVYSKSIEFPTINNSQDNALWRVNVTKNKNDEQLKNVFDYFDLYKYLEEEKRI